ncbi:ComEC family competence protein [Defluviimonas sp. WL0024]|uniref:ComEC family competence protein n=1 Tax=Albidovulum salinarum TaxID=2984153 RepID=A0ABT2WYA8_9RHOB|nr:ComEC/Rec2 family competence protein [Defluviimonas sp. WL0024]MCU9846663.1 ComEC family competence protein [Defluviimonas sp. WL0024]
MREGFDLARGGVMPWAPVLLGCGIGLYFTLGSEPGAALLSAAVLIAVALTVAALRGPDLWRAPALALALLVAGLVLAAVRSHLVAAPVLSFRYYGPVEGRIVDIDRSFSDQPRLTLDRVVLEDVAPDRTPTRVRIALHGMQQQIDPQPGLRVILTAHLSPPEGPVEPGGFDFQRLAWFSRLGAVGYTRTPVLALEAPEGRMALLAFRLRMALSGAMQARMEGQAGAFAAALMTGDRSGVSAATNDALRGSNLSHLISISGLHMGLLTGFVFAACRYGLALAPPLALRLPSKKIAAWVALLAASFYLVLAGPNVATRRAFIMAAVMLVAVLADRRAISLRSVALAALIVLVLEPESLVEPGFQMSFGATVALIVAFQPWTRVQNRVPRPLRPVAMMILSSAAAGFATAPIAAAHFNRIAEYGLLANMFAVPIMGMVVMPAGVVAALLAPLGLAAPALWAMEKGCALILAVADWVAGLDGAVVAVPTPPDAALPLIALGGIAALIGRALWLRGTGAALVAVALGLWAGAERPTLLVSGDGAIVGLMEEAGRALSKPKGAGFVAKSWLEDDGDMALQEVAYARPGFAGVKGALSAELAGVTALHFTGKGAAERAAGSCSGGALVILSENWSGAPASDCRVYDAAKLRATGALAIHAGPDGLRIVSAREASGERLWNRRPERRDRAKKPQ